MMNKLFSVSSLFLLTVFLGSGCSSPALKGTSFYSDSGNYSIEPGEERINLLPLLYHSRDEFHLLYPFFEKTEKNLVLRPVFGLYGSKDEPYRFSVLWPLSMFDTANNRNRIYPFFWGAGSFTALPLTWPLSDPYRRKDSWTDILSLASWRENPKGYSFRALGPVIHARNKNGDPGWGIWPLVGSYKTGADIYRYFLWPLGHQWSSGNNEGGSALLPLYVYGKDSWSTLFLSLPYSREDRKDGSGWQIVFPLFYNDWKNDRKTFGTLLAGYRRDGDTLEWYVTPLLAGGFSEPDEKSFCVLGPLASYSSAPDSFRSHVFPLYYRSKDKHGSMFITLPYSGGTEEPGKDFWRLLLPLYYYSRNDGSMRLISLPGMYQRNGESSGWACWPLLSGGRKDKDSGSSWYLGPIAHSGWGKDSRQSHVLPFYYHSKDRDGSMFISLPWTSQKASDGSAWQLAPPVYYHSRDAQGSLTLSPLYASGSTKAGNAGWQAVLPLYYHSVSAGANTWATLLGGVQNLSDGRRWYLTPLLSWGNRREGEGDFWMLGPMAHVNWDKEGANHHVLPLYYRNNRNGTLVSPLVASWPSGGDRRTTLIPPALSWYSRDGSDRSLWLLGPVSHFNWGPTKKSSHVFPLYYANQKDGTFVSPVAAKWRWQDKRTAYAFPPALSWMTSGDKKSDLWLAGPLAHFSWGKDAEKQHVLPLYYANRRSGTWVTPLAAQWKDGGTSKLLSPLFLGVYTRAPDHKELLALLGLFNNRWGDKAYPPSGYLVPFYFYEGAKTFHSLLIGWNRDEKDGYFYPLTPLVGVRTGDTRGGWIFPLGWYLNEPERDSTRAGILWSYYRRDGKNTVSGMFPFFGYKNKPAPEKNRDYERFGKSFWCLPSCWYKNYTISASAPTHVRKHGVFPLWNYSLKEIPDKGEHNETGSVLGIGYRHKKETQPSKNIDRESSSLLGFLWRSHREHGNLSVDVFPGFTYDRKGDDFRRFAWLGRMFRHERTANGVKMDIFFIPLAR
ncbi:MAG: hypothetical protein AB7T27_01445 [Kiritimatiellia bacterium]